MQNGKEEYAEDNATHGAESAHKTRATENCNRQHTEFGAEHCCWNNLVNAVRLHEAREAGEETEISVDEKLDRGWSRGR